MLYLKVAIWALQSDGNIVTRTLWTNKIEGFDGEREVASLIVFPSKYRDEEDEGETRRRLEKRGESAYALSRKGPTQVWYDGELYSEKREMV